MFFRTRLRIEPADEGDETAGRVDPAHVFCIPAARLTLGAVRTGSPTLRMRLHGFTGFLLQPHSDVPGAFRYRIPEEIPARITAWYFGHHHTIVDHQDQWWFFVLPVPVSPDGNTGIVRFLHRFVCEQGVPGHDSYPELCL